MSAVAVVQDWVAEGQRPAGQPGEVGRDHGAGAAWSYPAVKDAEGRVWRPVVDWEDFYEVSSDGRVRSIDRPGVVGRELRPSTSCTGGYEQVNLSANGEKKCARVHVLVAAAFIGPRPEGFVTRHLDGSCRNNRADNLAYGTKAENFWDIATHNPESRLALALCPVGHHIAGANAYRAPDRATGRTCQACRLTAAWASRQRRRSGTSVSPEERTAYANQRYLDLKEEAA